MKAAQPTLYNLTLSAFVAYLLAISTPLAIYLANLGETGYYFSSFLPTLLPVFGALWLALALPYIVPSAKFRRLYCHLMIALALAIWVSSSFFFGSWASEGKGLSNGQPLWSVLLEATIWLALLLGITLSSRLARLFANLAVGIFALILATDSYRWLQSENATDPEDPRNVIGEISFQNAHNEVFDNLTIFSAQENIIQIVLDEVQSTVFANMIERDPALAGQLDGFVFFPNTSSIYAYTVMSLPGILSGMVYDNSEDRSRYLELAFHENPFFLGLGKAGYETDFHMYHAFCRKPYMTNCSAVPQLSAKPTALQLLDFSLVRALPGLLQNSSHQDEPGAIQRYFGSGGYHATTTGLAAELFDELNERFSVADRPPTYKYFHSLISHHPLVLGRDCELLARARRGNLERTEAQINCAMSKVTRLLDNLKQNGIYDNSLIVISSDHGGNYFGGTPQQKLADNGIPKAHFVRAQGTLLIKPFASRGALRYSDFPARLSDIPATISALAEIESEVTGVNVLGETFDPGRPRDYFYIHWGQHQDGGERLSHLYGYRIEGDVRDPDAWNLVLTPNSASR